MRTGTATSSTHLGVRSLRCMSGSSSISSAASSRRPSIAAHAATPGLGGGGDSGIALIFVPDERRRWDPPFPALWDGRLNALAVVGVEALDDVLGARQRATPGQSTVIMLLYTWTAD